MTDCISIKALKIMQNLLSIDRINKDILPLNQEYEIKDCMDEMFSVMDYYPVIYEETLSLIIELAVILRRESEEQEGCHWNMFKKVKYSNVGKKVDTQEYLTFTGSLSKIIHADHIDLEVEDRNKQKSYGYVNDRNVKFTGYIIINGKERDNTTPWQYRINIIQFCIDAFMIKAIR